VKAKVISIDSAERKIGLSMREYQHDLDAEAQQEYAQSDAKSVSIGETLGDSVPKSMLEAGRSFTDLANEMMAAMNAQLAESNEAQAEIEGAEEGTASTEPLEETPAADTQAETPSAETEPEAPCAEAEAEADSTEENSDADAPDETVTPEP